MSKAGKERAAQLVDALLPLSRTGRTEDQEETSMTECFHWPLSWLGRAKLSAAKISLRSLQSLPLSVATLYLRLLFISINGKKGEDYLMEPATACLEVEASSFKTISASINGVPSKSHASIYL